MILISVIRYLPLANSTAKQIQDHVQDEALKNIVVTISEVLERSRATSTLNKYSSYFRQWLSWASIFNEIREFPATFYAIKHFHVIASKKDPTEHNLTIYILEAAKRICNRQVKKKEPITFENLLEIYGKIGKTESNLLNLRTFTLMVTSFAAFFRYSEASNLTLGDIMFHDSSIKVFIEKSKTDQYREGHWVHIAKTSLEICPVKILERYIKEANITEHNGFLFRATTYFKNSNVHKLRRGNKPISYSTARSTVLDLIRSIGLNDKMFGLHSLRSGGATAAARNGVPDRLFKNHGRWKSENVKDGRSGDLS